TSTEAGPSAPGQGSASTSHDILVTVNAVADAPTLTVAAASGNEDSAIQLSISSALTDTDGSESLVITITGVPAGATLNHGSYDAGTDTWTLSPSDLT